ncbi:hypothetical protein [Agriterribacter sp.]|uniref:hypothetical protein n=1 Tax=Agriterribacter sp. TaxID=2821509 RepID=UPI002CE1003C|nr:hypothetical protein [Agriterribacter sp.]HTN05630.1 hypothetical protein [Agriterribacter sp.]
MFDDIDEKTIKKNVLTGTTHKVGLNDRQVNAVIFVKEKEKISNNGGYNEDLADK